MAKKYIALYLTSSFSTFPDEVELWTKKPLWHPIVKEFGTPGYIDERLTKLCSQQVADVLGITLEIGECMRIEVRPQGLVRPKRAKRKNK